MAGLGAAVAAAAAATHLMARSRVPLPIAFALAWTAMEWTLGRLGPLAYPWLGLSAGLAQTPVLLGAADLAGPHGVGFLLALVNGLLGAAALRMAWEAVAARSTGAPVIPRPRGGSAWGAARPRRASGAAPAAGAALILVLMAGYGTWRAATLGAGEGAQPATARSTLRVALVQPELEGRRARSPEESVAILERVERLLEPAAPGRLDLVMLPEALLPLTLDDTGAVSAAARQRLAALGSVAGAPVLVGAYETAPGGGSYNAAVLVDGARSASYRKQRLIPVAESDAMLGPARVRAMLAPPVGERLVAAPGGSLLTLGGAALGPLICFEAAFAELALAHRRAGADLLVMLANDAWFGGPDGAFRDGALRQHAAHAVLRAVETRAPVIRVANRGWSQVVDAAGEVRRERGPGQPGVLVVEARPAAAPPPYVRTGDLAGPLAAAATLLLLTFGIVAARRRTG
mgnify:CR=1 FL=1